MVLSTLIGTSKWTAFWSLLAAIFLYVFFKQRKMTLHYTKTERNLRILAELSSVLARYYPFVLLPTIVKMYFSSTKVKSIAHLERQEIQLEDGERISLDWLPKNYAELPEDTPVILLVGGITTDSRAVYTNVFMRYAVEKYKFRIAIMNRRGYCNMPFHGDNPDPVSWDKYDDLVEVIKVVVSQFPDSNLYLAGLSMGANHIQRLAGMKGQSGDHFPIRGLGCIASPYCLKTVTSKLNEKDTILRRSMAASMVNSFKEQLQCPRFAETCQKRGIDIEAVLRAKTSDEFNEVFSMKFREYKTLNCYKEGVSSVGFIQHIKVPTLAVNSHSDKVSVTSAIPFDEINQNPNFIQVVTNGGGHLEYFSGITLRRWSYDLVLTYFRNLENESNSKMILLDDTMSTLV